MLNHSEILNRNQEELLPLLKQFMKEFYLVGDTAIALYIGHRRSIDFDLFRYNSIKAKSIIERISKSEFQYAVTRRVTEQLNLNINQVKLTFYQYPYKIQAKEKFENYFRVPSLIDLAAMKAFALGRRSKWKDYVDIYFLIRDFYTVKQISDKAVEIYDQLFSEKLFRSQLGYFSDIDYSEPVEFMVPPVDEEEIKSFLIERSTDIGL